MRKLLILSIALSLFLCACGSTDSSNADSSKQEGTTTTVYSTPENDDPSRSDSESSQQDSSEPDSSSSEKGSDPSSSETETTTGSKDSSHAADTSTGTELVTGSIGTTKKRSQILLRYPQSSHQDQLLQQLLQRPKKLPRPPLPSLMTRQIHSTNRITRKCHTILRPGSSQRIGLIQRVTMAA